MKLTADNTNPMFGLNHSGVGIRLEKDLKESKMKALRFHVIQLPGRVIHHARQVFVRVEGHCCELLQLIRKKISKVRDGMGMYAVNTT